jgi:type IV pilus assembly protein PilM
MAMATLQSTLDYLFPPPAYLALPAVGVDVSDTSLKYIRFDKHRDGVSLGAWGDLKIPDGVIAQGTVKDPVALGKVIAEAKKASGASFVRVSLPEERAYLFETTVARSLSPQEIYSALEFRLEENVPLSPRDAEFDYTSVGTQGAEEHVVVTVYAKETVLAYHEACRIAEVTPLSFEVEAQALARAVVREGDMGTYLIVDFGKTRTGVGIFEKGVLMLTSTIDLGGKDLDVALARAYPKADQAELIRFKNEHGLLASGDEPMVREALATPIMNLKNELIARIGYWNSKVEDPTRSVEKVILCGGIANLAGLPEYFTEALGLPVEQANVWQNAFRTDVTIPPITRRYSYGYATAVGLALGSFVRHV